MGAGTAGRHGLSAKGSCGCILLAGVLLFSCPGPVYLGLSPAASKWALWYYIFSSLTQNSQFTLINMIPCERTEGDAKSYTERTQRIKHWEQGSRIKSALRRKTSEDLRKAIEVFMDRLNTTNREWSLLTGLEWTLDISEDPWIKWLILDPGRESRS